MKKRLVLGDMHGRYNLVKQIYDIELPDDVIMLGDYVDTHDNISDKEQQTALLNLLKLSEYHKSNRGEFILLMGNHDFHYYFDNSYIEKYSGYSFKRQVWATPMFKQLINDGQMQMIFIDEINKTIYSHAGITNTWCKLNSLDLTNINKCIIKEKYKFQFTVGKFNSATGDSPENSCIWVRPNSLINDIYKDNQNYIWRQIVGHTSVNNILCVNNDTKNICNINDADIIFTDCITKQYLIEYIDNTNKCIKRIIKNIYDKIQKNIYDRIQN